MTTNNKLKHLPFNHREPTKEELCAQMDREEQQSALGRIRAEMDLQDQKKGKDYARSKGGQFLLNRYLNLTSAAIEQAMQASLKSAGHGSALVGEVYAAISDKKLVNLSKFDRDGRPTTQMTRMREKSVNL